MVCSHIHPISIRLTQAWNRDFNAPASQRPADSSAATIAANAFFILARLESDPTRRQKWIDHGYFILDKITTLAWKPSWPEALLSDGTVNKPAENYLTGTVYGESFRHGLVCLVY